VKTKNPFAIFGAPLMNRPSAPESFSSGAYSVDPLLYETFHNTPLLRFLSSAFPRVSTFPHPFFEFPLFSQLPFLPPDCATLPFFLSFMSTTSSGLAQPRPFHRGWKTRHFFFSGPIFFVLRRGVFFLLRPLFFIHPLGGLLLPTFFLRRFLRPLSFPMKFPCSLLLFGTVECFFFPLGYHPRAFFYSFLLPPRTKKSSPAPFQPPPRKSFFIVSFARPGSGGHSLSPFF